MILIADDIGVLVAVITITVVAGWFSCYCCYHHYHLLILIVVSSIGLFLY